MPSLIDIRRRIRSVKNTQQITKAMKMVSAAKLRRAQDRTIASRPYASLLRKVLVEDTAAIAAQAMELFRDDQIDAVYLLYNEFKSVASQKVTLSRVLPAE